MTQKRMHVFVATYDSVDDAKSDEKLVEQAYRDRAIGTYDVALVSRDAHGKVHVQRLEKPAEHGTEVGLVAGTGIGAAGIVAAHVAGAVVALASPPMLLADVALGALTGGLIGHLRKGMPEVDQEQLGRFLGDSPAALVLVAETSLQQALEVVLKHAKAQLTTVVLWLVNFGISIWNAVAVGRAWVETEHAGGFQRLVAWAGAYRHRTLANIGVAGYNTFAEVYNGYRAISGVPAAFKQVVSLFSAGLAGPPAATGSQSRGRQNGTALAKPKAQKETSQ